MAYCDRNFSVHCKNCSFWSNKCERKPIIYVAHPYGGLKENEEDTSEYVSEFIQQYPQFIFFSPVHNYSFYYINLYNINKKYWYKTSTSYDS